MRALNGDGHFDSVVNEQTLSRRPLRIGEARAVFGNNLMKLELTIPLNQAVRSERS